MKSFNKPDKLWLPFWVAKVLCIIVMVLVAKNYNLSWNRALGIGGFGLLFAGIGELYKILVRQQQLRDAADNHIDYLQSFADKGEDNIPITEAHAILVRFHDDAQDIVIN